MLSTMWQDSVNLTQAKSLINEAAIPLVQTHVISRIEYYHSRPDQRTQNYSDSVIMKLPDCHATSLHWSEDPPIFIIFNSYSSIYMYWADFSYAR